MEQSNRHKGGQAKIPSTGLGDDDRSVSKESAAPPTEHERETNSISSDDDGVMVAGSDDMQLLNMLASRDAAFNPIDASDTCTFKVAAQLREEAPDATERPKDDKQDHRVPSLEGVVEGVAVGIAVKTAKLHEEAPDAVERPKHDKQDHRVPSSEGVAEGVAVGIAATRAKADCKEDENCDSYQKDHRGTTLAGEMDGGTADAISGVAEMQVVPGAYACAPTTSEAHDGVDSLDSNQDIESGILTRSPTLSVQTDEGNREHNDEDGLMVAVPVDNEIHEEIYPAEPEQAPSQQSVKRKQQELFWKQMIFVASLVVIVSLALTITLVVAERDQPSMDNTVAPWNLSSANTSALAFPLEDIWKAKSIFPDYTVELIENAPDSVQHLAFQWVLQDPSWQMEGIKPYRIQQRFALASLYHAMSGKNWYDNQHWLSHDIHECQWFSKHGHETVEVTEETEVYYNDLFSEIGWDSPCLDLAFVNTTVPVTFESLAKEDHYIVLDLTTNGLTGSIPPELFLLTNLQYFSLMGNQHLTGSIASQIGLLTNIKSIDLGGTSLGGTLPTEIGLLSSSLRSLTMLNTATGGHLPSEMGMLSLLDNLLMDENSFSGSIPSEWQNLSAMRWWYMGSNRLSGVIPSWINHDHMPELLELWLDSNLLTGTFPTLLCTLAHLRTLSLWENQLTATIPSEVGLSTSLQHVYLDSNHLTGTLPNDLGRLSLLQDLQLWGNELSGKIPSELAKCTELYYLFLSSNQLSGAIPSELGKIASMEDLELDGNFLSGSIPSELGSLLHLVYLWLQDNLLTNLVPSEISYLVNVQDINLANNHLSGDLLDSLSVLASDYNMSVFNISGNPLLEGQVQEDLCNMDYFGFDCSGLLCGCGCPCFDKNGTTFIIIEDGETANLTETPNMNSTEIDETDL